MIVAQTLEEAYKAVDDMLLNNAFGQVRLSKGIVWARGFSRSSLAAVKAAPPLCALRHY